jgi:hypothetical protein
MPLDEAIRKRGFRRWHERQLYESHAHLVTGLLSLIMMAIAIEMIEFRASAAGLVALVTIATSRLRPVPVRLAAVHPAAVSGRIPGRARDLWRMPRLRPLRRRRREGGAGVARGLHTRRALPQMRPRVDDRMIRA